MSTLLVPDTNLIVQFQYFEGPPGAPIVPHVPVDCDHHAARVFGSWQPIEVRPMNMFRLQDLIRKEAAKEVLRSAEAEIAQHFDLNTLEEQVANVRAVGKPLARTGILEAISQAIATPKAAEYVRRRLAEQAGALSRDAGRELEDRTARLARVTERIRGLIVMQADGDRSPMVAEMRTDLEAQAQQERVVIQELRSVADAPIRLPPVAVLTERVLQLRTLAEASDIQGAREALRRYLKGGEIILIPDGDAYVARAEFMPLALLADDKTTPSEANLGGRCQSVVARGGFEPPTFGL